MTADEQIAHWKAEEQAAHIRGWDFSPIHSRYTAETDLPWDYENIVRSHLEETAALLDMDTGGGEFLLSLGHPPDKTSATEGYPPNAALCRQTLAFRSTPVPTGCCRRRAFLRNAAPSRERSTGI